MFLCFLFPNPVVFLIARVKSNSLGLKVFVSSRILPLVTGVNVRKEYSGSSSMILKIPAWPQLRRTIVSVIYHKGFHLWKVKTAWETSWYPPPSVSVVLILNSICFCCFLFLCTMLLFQRIWTDCVHPPLLSKYCWFLCADRTFRKRLSMFSSVSNIALSKFGYGSSSSKTFTIFRLPIRTAKAKGLSPLNLHFL